MDIDANEVIGMLRQEVSDLQYENMLLTIKIKNLQKEQGREEEDIKGR